MFSFVNNNFYFLNAYLEIAIKKGQRNTFLFLCVTRRPVISSCLSYALFCARAVLAHLKRQDKGLCEKDRLLYTYSRLLFNDLRPIIVRRFQSLRLHIQEWILTKVAREGRGKRGFQGCCRDDRNEHAGRMQTGERSR